MMRPELAEIVRTRYGDRAVDHATLLEPTDDQVSDYQRHNGLVSIGVDLSRSPSLIIVDTARLTLVRHAWVGDRQRESFRLIIASGNQPISKKVARLGTFDQKVEGLELSIYYGLQHRRHVPYTDTLKPLW